MGDVEVVNGIFGPVIRQSADLLICDTPVQIVFLAV